MRELAVDVVSDVVCPWCFIGTRRLEDALAQLPDVKAKVSYHPFLLDPTTPPEGEDLRERLRKKYGGDPERLFANVEEAAHSSGIALDFSKVRKSVSTVAAHTLVRHAADRNTQPAFARALFGAYFLEGKDIGQADVLADIATNHGFTKEEALKLATDPAELSITRKDASDAAAQGIRGVPFFVLDGRLAISGAQPPNVFFEGIQRALQE
jgi:predicted DsbA family dithiol-disulfide isomerase